MAVAVSVLIVSYNSGDHITRCLSSLAAETSVPYEVIVVDNASQDGTVEEIRRRAPEVIFLPEADNLGFARAVNVAAAHARGEYLLLLNPDTVVLDNAVERLLEFARARPAHGLYGGRTLHADGTVDPSSCWGAPTPWSLVCFGLGLSTACKGSRLFDPESLGSWRRDAVREVGLVTGCLLLVRREVFGALGGFDPTYFMYSEDVDLALRARRLGWTSVITPDAAVIHHVGGSSAQRGDKMVLVMTGKATLIRQHWAGWRRALGLMMLWLGVALRAGLSVVVGRRRGAPWQQVWYERRRWLAGYPAARVEEWRPSVSPPAGSAPGAVLTRSRTG